MSNNHSIDQGEHAIMLLHGLAGDKTTIWPLAKRLRAEGYTVMNWGYNSFRSIHKTRPLAEKTFRKFCDLHSEKTVHLVGHSMGAILSRSILIDYCPPNFGRLVMLTPPNQGSPWGRAMTPFLSWLVPPFKELSSSSNSFVRSLPIPTVPHAILKAQYDWIVPGNRTDLEPGTPTKTFPTVHTPILWRKDVCQTVHQFLQTGRLELKK